MDEAYDLLDDLIESSQEFEPSIAAVQSMLAGIARRLEKFKNEEFTWEDLRLYEQVKYLCLIFLLIGCSIP